MELLAALRVVLLAAVVLLSAFAGPAEQLVPTPSPLSPPPRAPPAHAALVVLPPQTSVRPTLACAARAPPALAATHPASTIILKPPCNCSIFAFLHLRKCAGTTMRATVFLSRLLLHQRFEPHLPSGKPPPFAHARSYCRLLADHEHAFHAELDARAAIGAGRRGAPSRPLIFDWEVHCVPALAAFVGTLRELRAQPERARGCALFSLAVLRQPVSWLVSDYFYFINEQDHVNVSLAEFAALKPEALLLAGSATPSLGIALPTPKALRRGARAGAFNASGGVGAQVDAAHGALREAAAQLRHVSADGAARLAAIAEARGRGSRAERTVDRTRGFFGRKRLAHMAVLRARAAYYAVLVSHGLVRCDEMLAQVDGQLAHIDLVGVAERFDETLLLAIDAGGLQALPPAHRLNVGEARREISPAALAELVRQNRCSILLYERWRARFDALVRAQPAEFGNRLRRMRNIVSRAEDQVAIKRAGVNEDKEPLP
ncbi:hypothetical protein KFE25_009197 [Diacronema lutheri]|uniref:Uncharacterized protein n=1 Tax=Diacronema lutheri TaxID=2081491 RepID=A0A8J5XXC2_DIALT|nr:hypothetical protein KFE25_009197 [Diacronema lutheri]